MLNQSVGRKYPDTDTETRPEFIRKTIDKE